MKIDKNFKGSAGDKRHIEAFMVWLGDKLFKIDNDYKATLEESYKKNLENIMGNVNYWETISKKLYKDATIKKMSDFYNLLSQICKLIIEYNTYIQNPKKSNRNRLGNYSGQCISYYRAIISSANGCKPYLQLLDNLKMIYENFRLQKMVNNSNLNGTNKELLLKRIKHLTTFNNENKLFMTVTANISFDDIECKEAKSNDEKIGEQIASKKSQDFGKSKNQIRGPQTRVSGNTQRGNPGSPQPKQSPAKPPTAPSPRPSPQSKPKLEAKQQQASQLQPISPAQSTDTQQSNSPPVSPKKPGPPPASSKKDTKLKTPQTGEIHENGPGGPGDGKGNSNSDSGVKSSGSIGGQDGGKAGSNGAAGGTVDGKGDISSGSVVTQGSQGGSSGGSGDESGGAGVGKKDINTGLGNHGDSSTQAGTNGGQRSSSSGTGDPVNGAGGGQGSGVHESGSAGGRSSDQSVKGSQGITSSESGGSSGGAGGGKGDAGSGGNRGSNAQGDQGKSPGGAGSVQGSHANKDSQGSSDNQVNTGSQPKDSGDPSRGNPIPAQPAPAPSGAGTTPSPGTSQPPVPSPQQSGSSPPIPPQSQEQKQKPEGQPSSQNDPSLPTPQTGGSSNQSEQKDSSNSKGSTGGASDGNGNSSGGVNGGGNAHGDQGNKSGGPSDPVSSTSGGSFGFGSSFLEFIFNGTNQFNKASEFIEKNHQTFKDAKDKISNVYNDAMDNLKIVYDQSNIYLNNFISNITSQLNQFDTPPKSGSSGDNLPQNSDQSQKNGNLPPLPPSNPTNPPPTIPPDSSKGLSSNSLPTSPQITPPAPPQNPIPNPTPGPPKGLLQQKQPPSQSQPNTQQPTQTNSSNQQSIGQLVKSLSSDLILKKPWNIFPTTWNGSGDCKPEIKFMNATLVCCTSEQCSLTGILITLVLIPIILSIAYKYLSFGSSKKSEKKNMKRVINFHDGNRKTKIIISSNDKKKDLKPVINSIDGKKGSLLNIYKLIQADPMPFINLFFLLIFFVYKRKRDTIE
ncbi:PIR protein CIR protein [Plasmodium vinckei lentum]|uniref:PIR protein CIR protein n=1 Tax=Plasmodium vinckei lentum TaxID=138297 RepID=A0A6V7S844_PLAVN|nr:PIR protein CIR protein [Plasmodium vinckei lentum]